GAEPQKQADGSRVETSSRELTAACDRCSSLATAEPSLATIAAYSGGFRPSRPSSRCRGPKPASNRGECPRQPSMLVPRALKAYPAATYPREDGMGEILGLGVTHFPPLSGPDENLGRILKRALEDPAIPERLRHPDGWPAAMREEYGADAGLTAARHHREALLAGFRNARRVLDEFAPDFVVIWGDDQYENFKEDIIPPFCVLAYESLTTRPWEYYRGPNVWNEPTGTTFNYGGHRAAGKFIASGMIEAGFDVSYAYKPLHHQLGHASLNTLLFPDYDRKGLPYPGVPLQLNCYRRP